MLSLTDVLTIEVGLDFVSVEVSGLATLDHLCHHRLRFLVSHFSGADLHFGLRHFWLFLKQGFFKYSKFLGVVPIDCFGVFTSLSGVHFVNLIIIKSQ